MPPAADSPSAVRSKPQGGPSARGASSREIPGARLTPLGVLLCVLYLGLPVAVLGNLADLLFQWLFGWCIGLWCIVN